MKKSSVFFAWVCAVSALCAPCDAAVAGAADAGIGMSRTDSAHSVELGHRSVSGDGVGDGAGDGVGEVVRREPGQPKIVQHYSCDGSPQLKPTDAKIVRDGGQFTFRVSGKGLIYFTIETEYADREPGVPGGTLKHRIMHYVLGTYEDGQGATARVFGRQEAKDPEAALVSVDRGWLWVSDSAPANWSSPGGGRNEAASFAESEVPAHTLRNPPAVSWSVYTLARSRYTWAGADATAFLFRTEKAGTGSHAEVVYNRDAKSKARHTFKPGATPSKREYASGSHSRVAGRADAKPVAQTDQSGEDKAFVSYAEKRVGLIRAMPRVGSAECKEHDAQAGR